MERLPHGWHVCQWCRSKHAGQFFELVPGEFYCVECAAGRLFKSGKLAKHPDDMTHDGKVLAIERIMGMDVSDYEIQHATKELSQWINEYEE